MAQIELLVTGYSKQCINKGSKHTIPVDIISIIVSYQRKVHSFILNLKHRNRWALKEDGLVLNKPSIHQNYGASVRFGEFMKQDENIGIFVKFKLLKILQDPNYFAFGFCTNEFRAFNESNNGYNHSCIVRGNGYFQSSKDFVDCKEYGAPSSIDQMRGYMEQDSNDIICVVVDMVNKKGFIWNDGRPQNVFEIGFGQCTQIGIIFYLYDDFHDESIKCDKLRVIEQRDFISTNEMKKCLSFLQ